MFASSVRSSRSVSAHRQRLACWSVPINMNASRIMLTNACCTDGRPISTMTRPQISVTGKPIAKRFSDGAARLTTPNARLTISSAVRPGSATTSAPREDRLAPLRDLPEAVRAEAVDADRQGAEAFDELLDQRQVAVEREEHQRREDHVELAEHRRAGAALRVDVEGEATTPCCSRGAGRPSRANRRSPARRNRARHR